MLHPAWKILEEQGFDALLSQIQKYVDDGYVHIQHKGDLALFNYTQKAQSEFDIDWPVPVAISRGLILDLVHKQIVALVMPKFHNHSQYCEKLPEGPFTAYEKLDGSMIATWYHNGKWNCSTRGSFNSPQALEAQVWLDKHKPDWLDTNITYIFEYIGPSNRIVLHYPEPKLVLLTGYWKGHELHPGILGDKFEKQPGFGKPKEYHIESIADIYDKLSVLDKNHEGFVTAHYTDTDNLRIKWKTQEYLRLHKLISRITPLAVWEILVAGDSLEVMRKELPDEFLKDFDTIASIFEKQWHNAHEDVCHKLTYQFDVDHCDRKDMALKCETLPKHYRGLFWNVFDGKPIEVCRKTFFKGLRPTSNILVGFEPTSSMTRFVEREL